uniref:Calpain 6 n=1 Tax=Paramormyrops kingsleyae TaxID=1676925 RepID=A0A3B3TEW5_9TELE|nr:calpain-5-like [Paramormyrops kingsleyae]
MWSSCAPYRNQRYVDLKQECREAKTLFEDPEFPATNSSLFYRKPPPGRVEWKRPKEICDDPRLFVEGISAHDLNQGKLGNCWFVAACSCLALRPDLCKKVIPNLKEQEWDLSHPENYVGIFHFQFWIFGAWLDVVVDDRLPTINGELIYCHSKTRNEFWSALLEKAYAKLSLCYESLDGGNAADAVVDFTGAVAESIDLEKGKYATETPGRVKLFEDLLKVFERGGIISCSIKASPDEMEMHLPSGLVKGHAYSVTAVRKARLRQGLLEAGLKPEKLPMIRLRNPWGKTEWNGPWSDSSEEWRKVGEADREALGITVADDGEFWMQFDDWCTHFSDVDMCRLINTSLLSFHKTWSEVVLFGSWVRHAEALKNRCGGCMNHRQTFLQNPQYIFDVVKEEDDVLISLQQRDTKVHRPAGEGDNLTIGFAVFKVELNREYRIHNIITQQSVAASTYINSRTVFMRKTLPKGRYVVIPSTFRPGVLGEFMLRIFTDAYSGCRELALDKPAMTCCSWLQGYPRLLTQIYVHGAEGLEEQDRDGGADPYVIIECDGDSVRSTVQNNTLEPVFDTRAIFYRRNPTKPITVQVWNSNLVKDQFMGQVVLAASLKDSSEAQRLRLKKRGAERDEDMPGSVSLRVVSSSKLTDM